MLRHAWKHGAMALAIAVTGSTLASAQVEMRDNRVPQLDCSRVNRDQFCEMRDQTVAASGHFEVSDLRNGSITVRGWDRNDVLVRMRVHTSSRSESDAADLAKQVHTDVRGSRLIVDAPEWDDGSFFNQLFHNEWWSVSVEVFAPHTTDLRLDTRNGPITVTDIRGRVDYGSRNGAIRFDRVAGDVRGDTRNGAITMSDVSGSIWFESRNGAVKLTRVGGSVQGNTRNGAVTVELTGGTFGGRMMDVETRNGAVTISMPRSYSAHVRAETRNGRLHSDFPVTVRGQIQGRDDGNYEFDLGSGGSPIRIATRNGGIRLKQS